MEYTKNSTTQHIPPIQASTATTIILKNSFAGKCAALRRCKGFGVGVLLTLYPNVETFASLIKHAPTQDCNVVVKERKELNELDAEYVKDIMRIWRLEHRNMQLLSLSFHSASKG
jgi:hypothetical protein